MMEAEVRQLMMTVAWMFARHGQRDRARPLCLALSDDNPRDGVVAAMCADLMLEQGEPQRALALLRGADFPPQLERAAALLEGRALMALGRRTEAQGRWQRYVEKARGVEHAWVTGAGDGR